MKLAYEIEIAPEEIETLVKMITSLVKEFIDKASKEEPVIVSTGVRNYPE